MSEPFFEDSVLVVISIQVGGIFWRSEALLAYATAVGGA
jgi:hypothetical protein